jgi:hypothetical protein
MIRAQIEVPVGLDPLLIVPALHAGAGVHDRPGDPALITKRSQVRVLDRPLAGTPCKLHHIDPNRFTRRGFRRDRSEALEYDRGTSHSGLSVRGTPPDCVAAVLSRRPTPTVGPARAVGDADWFRRQQRCKEALWLA